MRNRLRYILLIILLAVAFGAAGQGYVIDSVCRGADRHYRIDGEVGSTYIWTLTDPLGAVITLPETDDTVSITWNMNAGDYILSTRQTSVHGCDTLELGTIKVFELPTAYAGKDTTLCTPGVYLLSEAIATNYSGLLWTTSGDGAFNNNTILHPVYTPGAGDQLAGSVTLSLTSQGFNNGTACTPAESSLILTIKPILTPAFLQIGPLCQYSLAPSLPAVSLEGITGIWSPLAVNTAAAGTTTYTFTPDTGQCAIQATLNIVVIPLMNSTTDITICNNQLPYNWNGNNYAAAGTYSVTLISVSGCDSIATLNLFVNPVLTSTTDITICNNQLPYNWNGNSYTAAGTYSVTLISFSGCDSIATLNLFVTPVLTSTTDITICNNQLPYNWNGNSYTAAGTYQITLLSISGCDSIATLNLVVAPLLISITDITICDNQLPYSWNGNSYITSGTYSITLISVSGCDSIATLNLFVTPVVASTTDITICDNQLPYTWNGSSYFSAGTYQVTLQSVLGCDSIATLNLFVNPVVASTTNITICENQLPYSWNGNSYAAAGTYQVTLLSISGCDSIATLNLFVNPVVTSATNITICDNQLPYSWNGSTYTTAGTYQVTLLSISGCDSIATLNLMVTTLLTSTTDITICDNQLPYIWNGNSYTTAGTYQVALLSVSGCDSIATLNLFVNPFVTSTTDITICDNQLPYIWNGNSYTTAGTYQVTLPSVSGCDSVATLNLFVNPPLTPTILIQANYNPICSGTMVTFTSTITNGGSNPAYQWKKNNVDVGTNSPIYIDNTLANNDIISCVLTSNEVCASPGTATSNPVTMIVTTSLSPTILISADNNPICAGTLVTFTSIITNGGSNPVYQWKKNNVDVGTNSPTYSDNTLANNDIISCVLTSSDVCANPATVTSNPVIMIVATSMIPTIIISADNNPICAGTLVTFTSAITNGGSNPVYQWKKNNVDVGTNSPNYSDNTLANNDIISCVFTSNDACANPTTVASNPITMIVTTSLVPTITIVADNNPICSGTLVTFTSSITNGGSDPVYQWKKNGLNVGVNSPTYTDNTLVNNDVISCMLTSSESCANPSTVASNPIIMTVTSVLVPTIIIVADYNPICSGTLVTFTSSITNGGSDPVYQWKKNGLNVGVNSPTYSDNTLANNDVISCMLTSSEGCANPATVSSNQITMTVNANVVPTIFIAVNYNPICSGTLVTFGSVITNGGTNPVYQWKKNGINVGANSPVWAANDLANNDVITCKLTSNAICANPSTVTSNPVTMTVITSPTPTIFISANYNPICSGTLVTFSSIITNGGTNPVYQWKKNGIIVGANSPVYADNSLVNNDVITCQLTSNVTCANPSTVTSNPITMIVNPILTPTITITVDQNPICAGTPVTFTSTITNGGSSPVYQWKKNGVNVGVNSPVYTDNTIANNDVITCKLTSNLPCVNPSIVTSNSIRMIVNPLVIPTIVIVANHNPICEGTLVTFSSTITKGGSSPVYQWQKNGINVGANSPVYTDNTLANNDVITCKLTSNATCANPSTATSNPVTMIVNPILTPTIIIEADNNPICAGTLVTFNSTITNGGTNPVYQWKKNGINVGTNNPEYTDNTLANNDVISCTLISSYSCANPSAVSSNQITMIVNPILTPTITITADQNPICDGTLVTFTAITTNQGSNSVYQWMKNGVDVGTNSPTYSDNALVNNDVITCKLTSNAICANPSIVTSTPIIMTVNPMLTPTITIMADQNPICEGTLVIFTATATNQGNNPIYQWMKNGVFTGTNDSIYQDNTLVNGDVITCRLTSNATCADPSIVTSSPVIMTVNPLLIPTITITADQNPICDGTLVTFTATATNQGSNPIYQWMKNGVFTGTNDSTYQDSTLINGDVITCKLTSNATCAAPDTAISDSIVMTVNPLLIPTIAITADQNPICDGTLVTFTATVSNQGSYPVYQWMKNGIFTGTNDSIYQDSTLINGDVITCKLTSNATCAAPDTAVSNSIIMTVNPQLTPTITITADQNPICDGMLVTFTATATNQGNNPIYQWMKNGIFIGTNDSIYQDSTLVNGDVITCRLTSNATCADPSIISSSPIIMTVNPILIPTITITADQNPICDGTLVTFTAAVTNQGNNPVYRWMKNGLDVGTNSPTYYDNALVNNDIITCELTSNATCANPLIVTSAPVIVIVYPLLTPTIAITADQNPICDGTLVTFTAAATNQGTTPIYQWMKNGIFIGTNDTIYQDSNLVNGDVITCKITADVSCAVMDTATSAPVIMIVNPILIPTIAITADLNPICDGTLVTFTAVVTNQGSNPIYQWMKNGVFTGTNDSTYQDSTLVNGDVITCKLTSNATCAAPDTAVSDSIIMTVNPLLIPTIAITVDQNPICDGTLVTFTATVSNQGSYPVYQWMKNGIFTGTNDSIYQDSTLINGDVITCKLTSNATCAAPDTAVSNSIIMTVNPLLTPTISITADKNPICDGTLVTFTAMVSNQGSNPVYQWMKNGVFTGTNDSTYQDSTLINGDVITCRLTSNATCADPSIVTSSPVIMTVNPLLTPTISIMADQNPICDGTLVTFMAAVTNQGSNPVYQWMKNGVFTGTNDSIYQDSTLVNGDVITCKLTSNATCAAPDTAISDSIIMTVNPLLTPTITIMVDQNPICDGTLVTFTAAATNQGTAPIYQWMKNGMFTGTNDSTYQDSNLVNGDVITCKITANVTCAVVDTAISDSIIMIVNPLLIPTITITADQNPICDGTLVTFTALVTNQGSNPVYQWMKNGMFTGTNDSTYQDSTLVNSDVITCRLTSNATCAEPETAVSDSIIMTVNPLLIPTIAITVDQNPICDGTLVTFTATVSNQGSNPVYQWMKNGIFTGTNDSTYQDSTLINGDVITCKLTSNATCAALDTAISDSIVMTVNPLLTPTILIIADHNPICPGALVTFTTTVTNQGTNPFYRWRKNGVQVGTNSPSYADNTLQNNDVISCTLISNEDCADPDSVTSNAIMMVSPPLTPTIAISPDQNPICEGTLVTFTAIATSQGAFPIYQWKKNGNNVGTNDSVYRDSTLVNNDLISCWLWSSERCIDSVYVISNIIIMGVNPVIIPAITITYDHNPSCSGALVTFTAEPVNGGTNPFYRWRKNGVEVGTNSPTYIDNTLVNNDVINCTLISSETCADPDSAISNTITMVVSPAMAASIPNPNNILCYGNTNGSATVIVTGGTPEYNYLWNTDPEQTTQTATNLTTGNYIVTVTDLLGCIVSDTVTIGGPTEPLTVVVTSTDVNCVDANNGTATATVSGGTPGYAYQWNDPMSQTTPTAIRLTAGEYTVIVTDTNQCTATASASIGEPVTREPFISIAIDKNPVCNRTLVHFTSHVLYPGTDPVYQWMKNGVNVGTNDSVYADSTLKNNDVISCILTSSEKCAVPATKISEGIRISVVDPPEAAFNYAEFPGNLTGQIHLNNTSTGAETYYWDFGNGQTSNEENPTVTYGQDGNFLIMLVAYNEYNCTDTAWNKYLIEFYGLYIPNAFAPETSFSPANVFKPAGTNLKQYRIEVYDSWGNLMWESNALDSEGSPSESWNGTFRGVLMPQGTYMWKVNAVFNDNTVWQGCDIGKGKGKTIGTVTLIR